MKLHINSTRVKAPTKINPINSTGSQRTDDDIALNPDGRDKSESRTKRNKFLSCKKFVNIATQNVRTLRIHGKQEELAMNFNNLKIDILGIIDHKLVHEDNDVSIKKLDRCTLITTSAWRNANNAASGGVGILVSNKLENLISEIRPHTNRILQINISKNPVLSIIVNYAPVNGNTESEEHYERLSAVISQIPKHNMIIKMGDFNAHLGKDIAKHTYHENTNENGNLLHEHALECDLLITNTLYEKRKGKLWTYLSDMNGIKSQIDYILINKKWKNSIKNVEPYNSFSSLGSDHRILTAKVKLSLRMSKSTARKKHYDWSALRNSELQNLYTVTVKNRFEVLSDQQDDPSKSYGNFIQANREVAEELIPQKKKGKRKKPANDIRIEASRKSVQTAFSEYHRNSTTGNQITLQNEKNKLSEIYLNIQEEELSEMIQKVEDADTNYKHKLSWKLINEITGRKTAKQGMIRGNSKEERINQWFKHFSDLLGKEPVITDNTIEDLPTILKDVDINDNAFTLEELVYAKKNLCEGKSTGPDDIPSEVIKRCDFDNIIITFANKLLVDNAKPEQWSEIDLLPLPKSGDLGITENYRGIGLSSVVAKLINKMILNRLQPKIDPLLRRNQMVFDQEGLPSHIYWH